MPASQAVWCVLLVPMLRLTLRQRAWAAHPVRLVIIFRPAEGPALATAQRVLAEPLR